MGKGELLAYLLEKNRLETFKKWIFTDKCPCSAEKLAEAGFIFVGSTKEPDLVQCFLCKKQLDGWEKDDDPWEEHLSHSSGCKFATKRTPEENLTLNEMFELERALMEKTIEDYFDTKIKALDELFNSMNPSNAKN